MSRKGRISHDRVEALEKEVAELKRRLAECEKRLEEAARLRKPGQDPFHIDYVPQFDRWPGNER